MSPKSRQKIRILILASNPLDTPPLSVGREVQAIQDILSEKQEEFLVKFVLAADTKLVRKAVLDHKPHFVHFAGHGEGESGILLHDPSTRMSKLVSTEAIAGLFEFSAKWTRCVVLNCCYSQPQAEAIANSIPHVVGTRDLIIDDSAIEFASAFYEAISRRLSVPEAVDYAKMGLKLEGIEDSNFFVLQGLVRSRRKTIGVALNPSEVTILRQSLVEDRCRLVLFSRPNPRTLRKKGEKRLQDESLARLVVRELSLENYFDHIIYSSIASAPPLASVLRVIMNSLPANRHAVLQENDDDQVDRILLQLRKSRCLIACDGVDAILDAHDNYGTGFEAHGKLFRRIAESEHSSCLLLIGTRIPRETAALAGSEGRVRLIEPQSLETERRGGTEVVYRSSSRQERESPSRETLHHFLNVLEQRELIVILGPAAAEEGRKDGKRYPEFNNLVRRILAAEGRDPNTSRPLEELREILQRWDQEASLSEFLAAHLSGEPGPAHYYLAALSLALYPDSRLLLFLTTGFDDLMVSAFARLTGHDSRRRIKVLSVRSGITEEALRRIRQDATEYLRRGRPVIVKLFGGLVPDNPALRSPRSRRSKALDAWLRELMENPILFVGPNLEDRLLTDLMHVESRSPVFLVHPDPLALRVRSGRSIYQIPALFGGFTHELLDTLKTRESGQHLLAEIARLLRRLEPHALYPDVNAITTSATLSSLASRLRLEARLPNSGASGEGRALVPIVRDETMPDVGAFLQSNRPLLVVVGESGSGKSTLFLQIHSSSKDFISIIYDVHQIHAAGSLAARMAEDFLCTPQRLVEFLAELGRVLHAGSTRLLLLIDAINEGGEDLPRRLRMEIEALAGKLPATIKIAYSCRRIYWDNYIRNVAPLSSDLYFGSKEFTLGHFSPDETQRAFRAYQDFYQFRGSYEGLTADLKQRITDPLMLRMLAEGYRGQAIPSFAPAVLIFDAYERRFRELCAGTLLPDFLEALIALKLREAEDGRTSDQFSPRSIRSDPELAQLMLEQERNQVRPGNVLIFLQDEGILTSINYQKTTTYRITYDRFFEYLLGKGLSSKLASNTRSEFLRRLRSLISKLSGLHFSFIQGLKSEVIRLNILKAAEEHYSLYDAGVVRSLLDDADSAVVHFARDVLRELTFEGERDLLSIIEKVYPEASVNHQLMLDLAPDSARILPLVVHGLCSSLRETKRRCAHILIGSLAEPKNRELIEDHLMIEMRRHLPTGDLLTGFIYYTAVLFADAVRRDQDPLLSIRELWQKVLKVLGRGATDQLITSLVRVVRVEGGYFYGDPRDNAMDYIWTEMPLEIKEVALRMVPFFVDRQLRLTPEIREMIRFFGTGIRDWSARHDPSLCPAYSYKFEYRIAEWILIQRSRDCYSDVKEILQSLVDTGYWKSIDFALCILQYCCLEYLRRDRKLLADAFETMQRWTAVFRKDEKNFFFPLSLADPFSTHQSAISPAAKVAALEFSPREGPIPFLEGMVTSGDRREVLLALLCIRNLWKEHPVKVLHTLELTAVCEDTQVKSWLDRILKEIYLVYPRLVEDFFWRTSLDSTRIREIKHRRDIVDPSSVEHSSRPFFRWIFLGSEARREQAARWYCQLLNAPNLEIFCNDLFEAWTADLFVEEH